MPPQGEVARQWFIPGEGIDRTVISADIQRYLGNDATVRPGAGTGEYQGVQGYWIKAYRNLTSAMIADLRADSSRWRQEQRQTGGDGYEGSRTYNQSNAARVQRDGNSPSLDAYGAPAPQRRGDGRQVDTRRPPGEAMQIDTPAGRAAPSQGYGQPDYYPQDARGQYAQDPNRYPPPGRGGQVYPQDQSMTDAYGQPDGYGRYPVNYGGQPERSSGGYTQQGQAPPPGYIRDGNYYVPITTAYGQAPGMIATSGPEGYFPGPPQPPQQRGPGQANTRGGQQQRGETTYDPNYNPYPSPAQTVADPQFVNPAQRSGYPPAQAPFDQYTRSATNPTYPYTPETQYPPQSRDGRQPPSGGQSENQRRRRG